MKAAWSVAVLLIAAMLCSGAWSRLAEPTEEPVHQQTVASTTMVPSPPTPAPPVLNLHCFHQPETACAIFGNASKDGCRCSKMPKYPHAVVCCNITNSSLIEDLSCAGVGGTAEVQALHIINATLDVLNISLSAWKRLKSMSITDGKIGHVIGSFSRMTSISCLNVSNNGITDMEPRALVNLYNLTTLDLSHNSLDTLPKFVSNNITLDIYNNKPLLCSNLKDALVAKKELIFLHQSDTFCLSSKSFHWFNTTERVPFAQVEHIVELELLCPKVENKNCTCSPHRLDIVPGKPPTFAVQVDCSNKNLTKLPIELPPHTIVLNVSNNKITSLSQFYDKHYHNIRQFDADNNLITNILELEGTKFIDNFASLSLKANKLKSLPTYFLSNIFDRNFNERFVRLGNNRVNCDCNTAKILKEWLLTKQKNIQDYDEILCDNLPNKVIDLDQTKMCQSPGDWTDYIFYIITAEVLLLVGLICKVTYDYWIFKTAGYLPWPASKMPKLPCDCLCET